MHNIATNQAKLKAPLAIIYNCDKLEYLNELSQENW